MVGRIMQREPCIPLHSSGYGGLASRASGLEIFLKVGDGVGGALNAVKVFCGGNV